MALTPETQRPKAHLGALKPLLPFALAYKGRILAALLALVVASGATLILPLAVRRVVDYGFSGNTAVIDDYFPVLIAVVAVLGAASAARYYFVMTLGERVVADIRTAVFRHLMTLDLTFFDRTQSGEIVSRLTADTTQLKTAFGVSVSIALRNAFLFAGAVVLMIVTSPKLSALVALAIPVIVLPLVFWGRTVRDRSRSAQDRLAYAASTATEAVGAVRVMKAFGREHDTGDRFAAAVEAAFGAAQFSIVTRATLTGAAIFLVSASVVGVLWYGAHEVLAGTMSAGRLSQFVLYAVFAASALGQLSEVYGELAQAAGAAERLAEILDTKPAITSPTPSLLMPEERRGSIAFEDVHFSYPDREDRPALRGVSFTVSPGERVAIVGPSGAGKTTIFQLLLRFYDPQQGRILVDGIPIREAYLKDLREHFALVPQEPTIFAATIADNIDYGYSTRTDIDWTMAAQLASASEFIERLPQGYETMIGERGVNLSGGQRQRITIARAIYKNAPILLLDEATSALDAESERAVQEALERVMGNTTTLIIAHRLATVRSADRLLVLDDGRIVETGSHEELLARGGLYAKLARLQFTDGDERQAAE